MPCRGVFGFTLPSGRAETQTVVRCAQVRATLDHTARTVAAGNRRAAVARPVVSSTAVSRSAVYRGGCTARSGFALMARPEEIRRPLPDVACHVVEPEAIRWELSHRGCTFVAIEQQVLPGK